MSKQQPQCIDKKFKYNLTTTVKILLYVGLALAATCLVWNVVRMFNGSITDDYDYISVILALGLSVAFLVIATGVLINSAFTLKEKTLVVNWGVLKNSFNYSEIINVTYYKIPNKLVIYFKDETWFNIVISPAEYSEFADCLRQMSKRITYEENSTDKSAG